MQAQLLTVSELNEYLRYQMDSNPLLSSLFLRGEISNFTNHYKTGHFYFSLKDEGGTVRAVMFRTYASRVKFMPQNGMKVILHGRVSVFPRDGQYQIYADDMQPDGLGALYLAFQQLREKLTAEGLFDPARKRPLPRFPKTVGIVTSPTGAAVRDMIQILGRRYPAARVVLYPALVQGADAPASLVAGLDYFNCENPVDVILIGRGGGSAEDLFAFNDEGLVRAVAASKIPVISAVGHETDTTLCDFAADLRAPTPSAAAELAVPDKRELGEQLRLLRERTGSALRTRLLTLRTTLKTLERTPVLQTPRRYIEDRRMQLIGSGDRLSRAGTQRLTAARQAVGQYSGRLQSLNPLAVLSRGYAAVFDEGGAVLDVTRLEKGKEISVRFANGTARAEVKDIVENEYGR